MSLKAGIVGLPNVGKSTLFNAITKNGVLAANYPFATIEPNIGTVIVPDKRLDFLVNMYQPKSIVPTYYEFIDIAGLVEGASNGEGLGNKFLGHIRDVDAIVEVVRCFDSKEITHVTGSTDPIRDIEIINVELVLSDLEIAQNRLGKIEKKAETTKEKSAVQECEILRKCVDALSKNKPLRNCGFDAEELELLKNFNFITLMPIIYVANTDEETYLSGDNEYTLKVKEYAKNDNAAAVVICAKMDYELSLLPDEEKDEFLESLGVKESGMDRLIFATYDLLGLATFFTSGKDECRAWTFRKGTNAQNCAGLIHSDIKRGFIRAEVTSFDDLYELKDEKKVQEAGKLRVEGKDYQMQDGDIVYFRFNV